MSLKVRCPNPACGKVSRVPDGAAERSVACPGCGTPLPAAHTGDGASRDTHPGTGPAPAVAPPVTVGRFVVRERLGAGAFGTVYRAYDPQLDREVALKVPNPGALSTPQRVERFLREARAAANLRHPHVVPVYDAGRDGDRYFIASAFVAGKPLSDGIEERGTDFPRAARLTRELAEALAYAHDQGVVHRDVKPANVMLDAADHAHLMDFGLAARREEEARLTTDGAVLGTPSYMAPEQARGASGEAGPAADQYSAGVVLYELLTGRVPFEGPAAVVIHNVLHADPDPPRKHRPYLPRDLEVICLKAVAKRPEDRYPDCGALADDLRRWQEGEPIAARRAGVAERAVRWARKNKAVAGLCTVGVVATCLIGVTTGFALLARDARAAREAAEQAEGEATTARDREEGLRRIAEQAQLVAVRERDAAQRARDGEETQRKLAEEERRIAEEERRVAEAEREKFERYEYGRTMQVAYQEWRENNVASARALLERTRPDLRGWEWSHISSICNTHLLTLKGHKGAVSSASFSGDGSRIVTGSSDGTAKVWDAKTGAELLTLKAIDPGSVESVSFSGDGTRVVTGSRSIAAESMVKVWDARSGAELLTLKGDMLLGNTVSFSVDGSRIVTGSRNSTAKVWDAKTGAEMLTTKGQTRTTTSASFSGDGFRIVTGSYDSTARVWDAKTGAELLTLKGHKGVVYSASFSGDGSRIVTGSRDGTAKVWNAKSGAELLTLKGHVSEVYSASFSRDGSRIVTGSNDTTARVWDAKTGAELLTLKGHDGLIWSAAFSPDGSRIVTGGRDSTAKVWDAKTGAELLTPMRENGYHFAASFTDDGPRIVTGGNGTTAKVWDVKTGAELLDLTLQRGFLDGR